MNFLLLSRLAIFASLFSVDIVMRTTFFPFIGGKYYFFRFCVELALAFLLLAWAFDGEKYDLEIKPRLARLFGQPIFLAVSLFALIFLLASLFAYDPQAAFWSNFERGEGGFQMIHYYAFFILLVALFPRSEDWRRLFAAALAAAVVMVLYGIASAIWLGSFIGPYVNKGVPIEPTFTGRLIFSNARFQGALGNPAYVAPHLIFAMFYALWLWFSRPLHAAAALARRNLLWLRPLGYGALTLFFFLFFWLSQTRGAFLGLLVALAAFFLYLIFSQKKLRKPALLTLGGLILLGGLLVANRDSAFIQKIPGGRLLNINFGEQTVQTRLWTWNSAWQGFKERPILGWGPENFSAVFDRYFDPRHFVPGQNTETWFDRAHSVIFDYLSETGLLGFLSYLGIFAVFYWEFWRRIWLPSRKTETVPADSWGIRRSPVRQALLFALPLAYFVQGAVLFDVLPIYLNLFFFLAFATFVFYETDEKQPAV